MGNNVLFFTQIGAILTFITALFYIYRVLVKSKEATIQEKDARIDLLNDKIKNLEKNIGELQKQSPDKIEMLLNKRIKIREDEIRRLYQDKKFNKRVIEKKEKQIDFIRKQKQKLSDYQQWIEDITKDLVCPFCKSPIYKKDEIPIFGRDSVEGVDQVREFNCGTVILNGEVVKKCTEIT